MTISFWLYEEVKSLIMHIMEMELLCLLWGVWYGFIFNGTYFVDNDSDSNLTSPLKKSRTYWLNLIEICLHLSTALNYSLLCQFRFECSILLHFMTRFVSFFSCNVALPLIISSLLYFLLMLSSPVRFKLKENTS